MSVLHCGEWREREREEDKRSEMEFQCVRKSQGKCCLCVSGREEEEEGEEEGERGERERESGGVCVRALS